MPGEKIVFFPIFFPEGSQGIAIVYYKGSWDNSRQVWVEEFLPKRQLEVNVKVTDKNGKIISETEVNKTTNPQGIGGAVSLQGANRQQATPLGPEGENCVLEIVARDQGNQKEGRISLQINREWVAASKLPTLAALDKSFQFPSRVRV